MILLRRFLGKIRRFLRHRIAEWIRRAGQKTLHWGAPIGMYRLLDRPGEITLVLPGQPLLAPASDSLRVRCGMNQHGRQPWPIFWKHFHNARLVGENLAELRSDKRIMAESIYGYGYDDVSREASLSYVHLPDALHLEGPWTSLVSSWYSHRRYHYYHWIFDGLPRLALLDAFPPETRIIIPPPQHSYHRQALEILGVAARCRVTPETHLIVEDYYFSSPTAMTGCDNPYAIQFLRDRFLPAAAKLENYPEKIYVSRRQASRGPVDEDRIIDFLRPLGWTILEMEAYSLREQIALFSRARRVCSVHGAGLVNLLWSPPDCRILELCAANFLNGCYEGLAVRRGLDYRYLVFPATQDYRLKVDHAVFADAIRDMN
jgi:hypothetical protein